MTTGHWLAFGAGFLAAELLSAAVGLWLLRRAHRAMREEADMAEAGPLQPRENHRAQ